MRPMPSVRAFLLSLAFAVAPSASEACTCAGRGCASVLASTHLVEATVVAVDAPTMPGGDYVVQLADVRAVQGTAVPEFLIGGDGTSCSYQFTPGVRYLIDAEQLIPGRFAASLCGHTKPL